jgi:hypothetical protein
MCEIEQDGLRPPGRLREILSRCAAGDVRKVESAYNRIPLDEHQPIVGNEDGQ